MQGQYPSNPDSGMFGESNSGIGTIGSSAEDVFNQSLEEFDSIIGAEREAIASSGIGSAADQAFGSASSIGSSSDPSSQIPANSGIPGVGQEGSSESRGASPVIGISGNDEDDINNTVEGCEDEDKVARQLCEAATEEEDPFLRAALWDEYNQYKNIILRQ